MAWKSENGTPSYNGKQPHGDEKIECLFATKRLYDTLSFIRPDETPQQCAIRVRVPLQELVSERK
nr:3460_t:CDS:2 [Entrophospora candida]